MTPAHLDMDKCMTIHLDYELPEYPAFEEGYRRAPRRESHLTEADKILAIKNPCAISILIIMSRWQRSLPRNWRNTAVSMDTVSGQRESCTASPSTNIKATASRAKRSR